MKYALFGMLLLAAPVAAQDMPLSQILIDGETWAKVPPGEAKPIAIPNLLPPGITSELEFPIKPAGSTLSADKTTLYIGDANGKFLWAFPVSKSGALLAGSPYAPLRSPKESKNAGVTALTADAAGRIYAATPLGIQVFDPTGRLCGVVATPGQPKHLDWTGPKLDLLIIQVGDTQYQRKLNATKAK